MAWLFKSFNLGNSEQFAIDFRQEIAMNRLCCLLSAVLLLAFNITLLFAQAEKPSDVISLCEQPLQCGKVTGIGGFVGDRMKANKTGVIGLLCARPYPLSRFQWAWPCLTALVLRPMQNRCLKPRRKTWPLLIAGEA